MTLRVAFNVEQLLQSQPGGIGRYTAELVRLLRPPIADVELIPFCAGHRQTTIDEALVRFELAGLGLRPVRVPLPRPLLYDLWHLVGAPRLGVSSGRLRGVDLVHAPSLAVPPRGKAPLVVTVNDAAPALFPETSTRRGRWFHRRGAAMAARRADLVIVPTQSAADEIAALTPIRADRMRIVPHGVRIETVTDEAVAMAARSLSIGTAPYVLWVGTLEPRKNLTVLLEAFRAVERAGLPHHLVVVGPRGWGSGGAVHTGAAAALGDRLHLVGDVPEDRLRALYRGADLFAFPSLHEGFGLPVLEAMAQGTAVACSDLPVLREVAGGSALFVAPNDIEAWERALVDVLRDERVRSLLARDGRERVADWTWEQCARRTVAVYEEVLGR